MGRVLDSLPGDARIAVIRLRSLGDCVLTTPALNILKRARPGMRLAVIVEDRFRAVFEGNPDIDELLPPRVAALRRLRPDLCLNLHGGGGSALLTILSGAAVRAGFGHFRHGFAYDVRIPRAQDVLGCERKVHTAEHLASAMFYLGCPAGEIPRARLFADPPPPGRPYAVLHAVAAAPEKTWRADGFAAVAAHLRATGLDPVFIGGGDDNLSAFRAYRVVAGAPLAEIKTLLRGASIFVGNDSGPAHMAAAFGIPAVVIFGASDHAIWGPWRTPAEVLTGIDRVQPADVLRAIEKLRVAA